MNDCSLPEIAKLRKLNSAPPDRWWWWHFIRLPFSKTACFHLAVSARISFLKYWLPVLLWIAVPVVSWAIVGNLLDTTMDSSELESFGSSGAGQWVTIYANSGHTFMVVAGLRYAFPKHMKAFERDVPRLVELHDRVAGRPNIKAYLASERRIPFNEDGIFRHYSELDA
jgi:hypothetical protein